MNLVSKAVSTALITSGLLFSGCGDSDSNDKNDQVVKKSVALDFDAVVADQGSVVCSENNKAKVYNNLGNTNASGSIADFRFFVSKVKVKLSDGTTQEIALENNSNQYYDDGNGSVAILDFEDNTGACIDRGNDSEIYKTLVGEISVAKSVDIEGIEFTVGVPVALNHIEFPEISALTKAKMNWSWAAGRKFTKFEINPSDANNSTGDIFNFHLGSTGCVDTDSDGYTDECAQPNRVVLSFDDFDPDTQKIVIDYAELLANVNITTDGGGAKGCMSKLDDPECMSTSGKMFNAIGLDDASQNGTCLNGDCTLSQRIFSVKSK